MTPVRNPSDTTRQIVLTLLAAGILLVLLYVLPPVEYVADGETTVQAPLGTVPNEPWLTIRGRELYYQGQRVILRGVNFSNVPALGAGIGSGDPADVQITAEDYLKLRQMGGNHARFGLSFRWYDQHLEAFWAMLDAQVSYARQAGIWLVFVMFTTPGDCYEGYGTTCPFWNSTSEQQQLRAFWIALVRRYASEPTVIGIDIINEPTPPRGSIGAFWDYAGTVRDAVTVLNPHMLTFIEAGSTPAFGRTMGPNVIYEVHDYTPHPLTHGAKSWTDMQCVTGASYPGTMDDRGRQVYYDKNVFANSSDIRTNTRQFYSINWAQMNNVPLYIGEWGAQASCPGWDQFLMDKASLYNQWGVHWAFYGWRSNPGNFDVFAQMGALRVQDEKRYQILLEALSGAEAGTIVAPPPESS